MDYGEVLSRAWQIIWKYKALWIFGILAGCVSGGNSAISYNFNYPGYGSFPYTHMGNNYGFDTAWLIPIIIFSGIFVLALIILAIFLGTVSRIGLIRGTMLGDSMPDRLPFRELFSGSLPYFWRIFGLNLLIGLLLAFAGALLFGFMFFGTIFTLGLALLCFLPLLCLLIPVSVGISLWLEQVNNAIVVENLDIFQGLRRGWEVFKKNLGSIIVMGLILFAINLAIGLAIALPFGAILLPLTMSLFTIGTDFSWVGLLVSGTFFVIYLPVLIFLSGILKAYVSSSWTLTYLRLTGIKRTNPTEIITPPIPTAQE